METHMSPLTIFLAKLIGLFTLIVSVALVLRRGFFVAVVAAFMQDRVILLILGMLALITGLAMVLTHNRWSGGVPTIVVTGLGWVFLVRGLLLLFLPSDVLDAVFTAIGFADHYTLYAAIPFLLGAYLTYAGFTADRRAQRRT
jgi:hypothetical protein